MTNLPFSRSMLATSSLGGEENLSSCDQWSASPLHESNVASEEENCPAMEVTPAIVESPAENPVAEKLAGSLSGQFRAVAVGRIH